MMKKKMSTRATGDKLESFVAPELKKLGFRPTAGSGSVFKDGDFSHPEYVLTLKNSRKNQENKEKTGLLLYKTRITTSLSL